MMNGRVPGDQRYSGQVGPGGSNKKPWKNRTNRHSAPIT